MGLKQRVILTKSFIETQCGYCPLIWIPYDIALNRKINHLHKCSLRIVCRGDLSTFHELLKKRPFFHYSP